MIFPHGLPDGCPCVYASLPAQSHKKEKTVVITPSAVYLWALLEKVEPCQAVVVDGTPSAWEMVPVCGLCDLEAPNALEDPGGVCLQCGSQLWMGPFIRADQLPLVGTTKDEVSGNSILIYEEIEEAPGVSAAVAPAPESHVPIPHSEACCNEECAFPSKVALIEGEALETAAAVIEMTPSGWTVDTGAAAVPEEPESGGEVMASPTPMPSWRQCRLHQGGDTDGEIVSEPTADFRLEAVSVVPEVETLQPEVPAAVDVDRVPEEKSFEDDREDTSVIGPKESLSTSELRLRNSGPWVDVTLTTYTALSTPTCALVLTHAIDFRKFSFGRIGSVLPVTPTFRDPPLSENEDDDWKSVSENAAQIRCKCQRSVVSEPVQSCNPKVMVHVTPSEPRESTHVSELYHLEWGKISLAGEKDWVAKIPRPKVDSTMATAPGWEEYDEEGPELDDQPAPKEFMSCSFTAPPKIGPEEEKDFWVLPGRADPNIFRSVSRVQWVINFRGYRKLGYFMPYAPLWVCLKNPNEVRRKQDWEYLRSIEREWWYGCTILKNAVKSCGKYNPTKYFSLEVYEGQWVDKPHPKYYIPYEDTKARFLHMI
ncbi:hypothetical protein XELAEV_18033835mg [Xenopus laevis]|uniref:Uncharacterized protein n=1 Tax=Xenopus laevis TaxID=8355 RepID=A0A974CKR4_XENLA|nr:hypothetical protein XELAEV_18033835mg [Xenopus laevis]